MRRIVTLLLSFAAGPALAAPCTAAMAKGDVCDCTLASLHPTQLAVGQARVEELKQEGFDKLAKSEGRPGNRAQVVLGPGGGRYLVDGHHHARAMSELRPGASTMCEIAGSAQDLPTDPASFWPAMAARGFARLKGPDGVQRPGVYPPPTLAGMADDPFRTVAGWVEYVCHAKLEGDFAEFTLADLLRADPANPAPHDPAGLQRSEQQALRFVRDPANQSALAAMPGGATLTTCR